MGVLVRHRTAIRLAVSRPHQDARAHHGMRKEAKNNLEHKTCKLSSPQGAITLAGALARHAYMGAVLQPRLPHNP